MSEISLDLVELTVEQAQSAFAAGTTTSEALTQAFLDRIARLDPHYNAIIFLNPDALADARSSDQRRAAGQTLGPLDGVPVVVKDPMDMVGFPTTAGWRLLYSQDRRRRPDARHRFARGGPHEGGRHGHPR